MVGQPLPVQLDGAVREGTEDALLALEETVCQSGNGDCAVADLDAAAVKSTARPRASLIASILIFARSLTRRILPSTRFCTSYTGPVALSRTQSPGRAPCLERPARASRRAEREYSLQSRDLASCGSRPRRLQPCGGYWMECLA
jgi:hypothetical protein